MTQRMQQRHPEVARVRLRRSKLSPPLRGEAPKATQGVFPALQGVSHV